MFSVCIEQVIKKTGQTYFTVNLFKVQWPKNIIGADPDLSMLNIEIQGMQLYIPRSQIQEAEFKPLYTQTQRYHYPERFFIGDYAVNGNQLVLHMNGTKKQVSI